MHKKGSKHWDGNCSPVSLASVACKILESIIRDAIFEHIKENLWWSTLEPQRWPQVRVHESLKSNRFCHDGNSSNCRVHKKTKLRLVLLYSHAIGFLYVDSELIHLSNYDFLSYCIVCKLFCALPEVQIGGSWFDHRRWGHCWWSLLVLLVLTPYPHTRSLILSHVLVASLMSLTASLVTTSKMQQCINVYFLYIPRGYLQSVFCFWIIVVFCQK